MAKKTETEILQQAETYSRTSEESLKSIDLHVQTLDSNIADLSDFLKASQAAFNSGMAPGTGGTSTARRRSGDPSNKWKINRDGDAEESPFGRDPFSTSRRRSSVRSGQWFDEFTDKIEAEFWKGMGAADISRNIAMSLVKMSQKTGKSFEEMFDIAAKDLGKSLSDAVKKTNTGRKFSADLNRSTKGLSDALSNFIDQAGTNIAETGSTGLGIGNIKDFVQGFGQAFKGGNLSWTAVADGIGSMSQATAGLGAATGSAVAALGPYAAAAIAASVAIDFFSDQLKAIGQSLGRYSKAVSEASNRTQALEKKARELGETRLKEDLESMIKASYDVMEEASQKMLSAWDNSLKTITATQGYSKADLQTLIGSYAERLRDEGLSSVVSVADITENLTNVLKSGLSGQAAEEFAYLATKLNAAVPTEDFFSYASTYASVASNAIAAGASQAEAIAKANAELEEFANNLLYSSRELAGGFSTGLTNASNLFEKANEIAVASRIGDASQISGVLTAVSAAVGSVAPDLASGLVDAVVSAALGGNTSTTTALRSLAGTGASNTAFLQALAKNPKEVFTTLFRNLSEMQTMNSDNYMEVADSLSQVFGLDRGAFARVDFGQLADTIYAMNNSSDALNQNMELLQSGQSTATAEQLRTAEINKYMIEEGLSYVLDNEVARSIQQHMWDEQLALEIQQNTFGVEMVGATAELLQTISHSVENILGFLNPKYWIKRIFNVIDSAQEVKQQTADVASLLEATKVGNGNAQVLANLTSRGTNLNLTKSYTEMLGVASSATSGSAAGRALRTLLTTDLSLAGLVGSSIGRAGSTWLSSYGSSASEANLVVAALQESQRKSQRASGPSSSYSWANVGKSALGSITAKTSGTGGYEALSTSTNVASASRAKLSGFFESMDKFVQEGKSYDEWVATSKSYGIADVSAALADYGLTQADAKNRFQQLEAQETSRYNYERQKIEDQFWNDATEWYENTWVNFEDKLFNERMIPFENTLFNDHFLPWEQDTWPSYLAYLAAFEKNLFERHVIPFEERTWPTYIDTLLELQTEITTRQDRMYNSWVDYYVNHTAYSAATLNAYDVQAVKNAEQGETGQAVLALAQALTANEVNLKDPVVQTNVILAQILIVAEAIMQQVNNTSTVSLPTALSALGLNTVSEGGTNIRQ